jgi:ribosomal protein L20A (L18A)
VEVEAESEDDAKERVLSGIVEENQISREFIAGIDEVEEVLT